ncbi:MAG: transposase [Proteobacteria bacterium]|nr:transposase [Pseudomonadota bacterium]
MSIRPASEEDAARKRLHAGLLMLAGRTPAEAAHAVGVARQTAYKWKARLDDGGIDALRSMTNGRPAQLDADQLRRLRAALLQGALAHGFRTDGWTPKRAGVLIERLHGVRFSDAHVRRLLASVGYNTGNAQQRHAGWAAPAGVRGGGAPSERTARW